MVNLKHAKTPKIKDILHEKKTDPCPEYNEHVGIR